jgi:hypothetical protein
VQLDQTLLFAGSTRKLFADDHRTGFAASGTTPATYTGNGPVTYTINGVDATQPLKVTLVWTDYPSTPDAPPMAPTLDNAASWNAARLVNDLDLTVSGPAGTYLGNVFTDGASSAGGEADRRNNVEQVLLTAPTAGAYTIAVQPTAVVEGPQDFAIVITGAWANVGGTTPPPGGDASPPEGGSAGAGGAAGAGGGPTTTPTPSDTTSGCNCELAHRRPVSGTALLALAALPLSMLRGRRRSGRRLGARRS